MKRVGITSSRIMVNEKPFLGQDTYYFDACEAAGMEAVVLPRYTDEAKLLKLLDSLDGIIFTGGTHIGPQYYNKKSIFENYKYDFLRDEFELKLAKLSIERKIPILGICRGHQLLNVALNGTLYQDVNKEIPTDLVHFDSSHVYTTFHDIDIFETSEFFNLVGKTSIEVNTIHSQSVNEIGNGLIIEALASDKVIEAMRLDGQYLKTYQFHPEKIYDKSEFALNIFKDFEFNLSDKNKEELEHFKLDLIDLKGMDHYLLDEDKFMELQSANKLILFTK